MNLTISNYVTVFSLPSQRRARRLQGGDASSEETERKRETKERRGEESDQEEMSCDMSTAPSFYFPLYGHRQHQTVLLSEDDNPKRIPLTLVRIYVAYIQVDSIILTLNRVL